MIRQTQAILRSLVVVLSTPFHLKIKGFQTKFILKKVDSRVLPKEVVYRKKSGFGVPLDDWFRAKKGLGQYLDLIRSTKFKNRYDFNHGAVQQLIDQHLQSSINCGELLWELVNLELWATHFIDRLSVTY